MSLTLQTVLDLKNSLLKLSNMSDANFKEECKKIWGTRGNHMYSKFHDEKKENIWNFFICLDETALEELVERINEMNNMMEID